MKSICRQCQSSFTITPQDQVFYKRIAVPSPTLCPDCRQQRRLAWRNERSLYQSQCQLCQRSLISLYSPDKPYTIYCQDCWWSDRWDPLKFGRGYTPGQSFFEQFRALQQAVPRMAITTRNCENCDYAPWAVDGKNLYLSAGGRYNEDCMYGMFPTYSKDCVDFIMPDHCELCYEIIECVGCYHVLFSQRCHNCKDSYFCYDCRSCSDCFGCVGLRNRQYCWFNEQLTADEYQHRLQAVQWTDTTIQTYRAQLAALQLREPQAASEQIRCENSTGDLLTNCQNVNYGFDVQNSEQCSYVFDIREAKDSYDCFIGAFHNELTYECHSALDTTRSLGLNVCWDGNDAICYCDHCFGGRDLFGCIGLRRTQYCILNKHYTKADYDRLKEKIIAKMTAAKEWGEFFPILLSPFAYNETVAQEYFPLTKEAAVQHGWSWHDSDQREYQPAEATLPSTIADTPDTIVGKLLACAQCHKNYRLIAKELHYYRRFKVPPPRCCPQCRHLARMRLRNPRHLWPRRCDQCAKQTMSSFAPDRPEIVYCPQCYQRSIY